MSAYTLTLPPPTVEILGFKIGGKLPLKPVPFDDIELISDDLEGDESDSTANRTFIFKIAGVTCCCKCVRRAQSSVPSEINHIDVAAEEGQPILPANASGTSVQACQWRLWGGAWICTFAGVLLTRAEFDEARQNEKDDAIIEPLYERLAEKGFSDEQQNKQAPIEHLVQVTLRLLRGDFGERAPNTDLKSLFSETGRFGGHGADNSLNWQTVIARDSDEKNITLEFKPGFTTYLFRMESEIAGILVPPA